MREHYREQRAQQVSDQEWIALVADRNWIGFNKDANIRRNALERQTVLDTGARLFCVPRADILAEDVAARFIANIEAIARAARSPGPFIYTVHPKTITRVL
jgi:PIN domain-containing protein